jgi:hypothetical protein
MRIDLLSRLCDQFKYHLSDCSLYFACARHSGSLCGKKSPEKRVLKAKSFFPFVKGKEAFLV